MNVNILNVQPSMWCNLSLTLKEIPDAGLDTCSDAVAGLQAFLCTPWNYIQKQVTREGPSTALQGRKVTAAARRCPATSHSQAPSPMNPRPPTDTNGYRNYESVLVGMIYRASRNSTSANRFTLVTRPSICIRHRGQGLHEQPLPSRK